MIGDRANDAKLRVAGRCVRRGEVCGVGEVEELRTEPHVPLLADARVLDKRHVEVERRAGTQAGVSARGVAECVRRGIGKLRGVEPALRDAIFQLRAHAAPVRARPAAERKRVVQRAGDAERVAAGLWCKFWLASISDAVGALVQNQRDGRRRTKVFRKHSSPAAPVVSNPWWSTLRPPLSAPQAAFRGPLLLRRLYYSRPHNVILSSLFLRPKGPLLLRPGRKLLVRP